jgi:ABC-type transport system substrate-binding protein
MVHLYIQFLLVKTLRNLLITHIDISKWRKIMNKKKLLLVLTLSLTLLVSSLPLGVATAQEEPLFKVTIIAPGNANMVRRQWGQIYANSLNQLGIEARVVYLGWASVYDRVFTPPPNNVGKTYAEGGFDMQLVGWTPGLIPEPKQIWYGGPGNLAPTGSNYYLWENAENDRLIDEFITSTDPADQERIFKEWQELFYDTIPASQIFYSSTPAVVNPDLSFAGDWWLHFNVQPGPQYIIGKEQVVYASTGEIESLIPTLSNSWYDTIIQNNIYQGLDSVAPDLSDFSTPSLFTSWTASEDGFSWTFTCREGVKWHDGESFTADDVIFSLWALMNPATGSQHVGVYQGVYGNNLEFTYSDGSIVTHVNGTRIGKITAEDPYTIAVSLPEVIGGKAYGYFDPYLLTYANNIIPKHIFENMEPVDWTDSPFNTGQGSIEINGETYTGPIGTGPYQWVEFDPVNQLVHLEKFEEYWGKTDLEAQGYYEVEDYYIKFIADKTPALASLKNDQVDILDPQYQMQVDVPTIDPTWGKVILLEGTGRQEIGYNMRHPIYGTGVDTPLGKSDPSRAAEAAEYVRIAFDYAIPRELIIDNLMAGFGQPGATPALPAQPYYNTEITPRAYDLSKAREYLQKAGYSVPTKPAPIELPSFILGMSTNIHGTYTAKTGEIMPNRELALYVTTDNETYTISSEMIGKTTTDVGGFYSFTATPMQSGDHYYWLFDRLVGTGKEWIYVGHTSVDTLENALTPFNDAIDSNTVSIEENAAAIADLETQIGNIGTSNTPLYVGGLALVVALVAAYLAMQKKS